MAFIRKFIILYICITIVSCQKEKSEQVEQLSSGTVENTTAQTDQLPNLTDDFLVSVYEAQELIKISQEDQELRRRFCELAYLKDHNMLITMGIAKLHNPETGQPIANQFVERAAKLDAIRWMAYGEQWLKNNYQPAFGQFQGNFNKPIQIIDKAFVGDSLFLFISANLSIE